MGELRTQRTPRQAYGKSAMTTMAQIPRKIHKISDSRNDEIMAIPQNLLLLAESIFLAKYISSEIHF